MPILAERHKKPNSSLRVTGGSSGGRVEGDLAGQQGGLPQRREQGKALHQAAEGSLCGPRSRVRHSQNPGALHPSPPHPGAPLLPSWAWGSARLTAAPASSSPPAPQGRRFHPPEPSQQGGFVWWLGGPQSPSPGPLPLPAWRSERALYLWPGPQRWEVSGPGWPRGQTAATALVLPGRCRQRGQDSGEEGGPGGGSRQS